MTINKLHKNIHFIGIGGISMSALAHIMLTRNFFVSGSDAVETEITNKLKDAGAKIYIGHSKDNIQDADLVVYTAAIANNNEELVCAREKGVKTLERADFLGEMMKDYDFPISISGTHGKTTTTSMLSCVLLHASLNPTILVGGELSQINGNYHVGDSKYLVFEGCEYVDSFLKFDPFGAIILNIEEDHLDYFSGIEQIKQSFIKFMEKIPQNGFVTVNADDKNVMDCAKDLKCNVIPYGENGDYSPKNIIFNDTGCASFDVLKEGSKIASINLSVAGIHNVSNALAVFATAMHLGISTENIEKGIESFKGAKRRFEKRGEMNGAYVYDDYAHHPTEIIATLTSAKNIPHNKTWCIFQPHTYTRTKALLDDFAMALKNADEIIITDIYAAREKNTVNIHSTDLANKIPNSKYISDFNEIASYIKKNAKKDDIIIAMGAGTVNEICNLLIK